MDFGAVFGITNVVAGFSACCSNTGEHVFVFSQKASNNRTEFPTTAQFFEELDRFSNNCTVLRKTGWIFEQPYRSSENCTDFRISVQFFEERHGFMNNCAVVRRYRRLRYFKGRCGRAFSGIRDEAGHPGFASSSDVRNGKWHNLKVAAKGPADKGKLTIRYKCRYFAFK